MSDTYNISAYNIHLHICISCCVFYVPKVGKKNRVFIDTSVSRYNDYRWNRIIILIDIHISEQFVTFSMCQTSVDHSYERMY